MKRDVIILVMALMGMMITGVAQADLVINEYSHANDGAVYGNGNFSAQDLIVGAATGGNYAGIAFFELPDLSSYYIQSAQLTLTVVSGGSMPTANADLYVLGYVSSPPSLVSSWLLTSDTETRDGDTLGTGIGSDTPLKLADNLVTAGTTMNPGNTSQTNATQSITLAQYLTSLYDVYGAVAGDYVVIRVNPDFDEWQGSNTNSSKNFRYGGSHRGADAALLTLTLVPEPATFAMVLLAAPMLIRRRHG